MPKQNERLISCCDFSSALNLFRICYYGYHFLWIIRTFNYDVHTHKKRKNSLETGPKPTKFFFITSAPKIVRAQ